MSFSNNQGSTGGFRDEVGAPSSYSACGAGELKLLLQRIAEYIASADERQQAALGEMQSRLAHLADEAHSVRTVITPELAAAFARIEESISTLTQRVAADERGGAAQPSCASEMERHTFWSGSSHENPAFDPKPAEPNARHSEPIWSRSRTDPPPPLRSAANPSHFENLDGARARPSYASSMAEPHLDVSDAAGDHGVWDRASAEALARSYEPEHFGDDLRGQSFQSAYTQQHTEQPHRAPAPERNDGQRTDANGDHFEQRFAELADRVEEALVELRTNSSVTALKARLDSFDKKLGSAVSGLATRADVEKLRAVEAHISELARHVDRAQHRLARLDEIEHNLTRLIDHLSDERLLQLFDQRVLSEPRLAALAEAVAERLAARETARGNFGVDRLGELHDIIEQFLNNQRREGEQTASALEAIQEAMLNLLDRMDVLEGVHTPAPPANRAAEADWRHKSDGLATAGSAYGLHQSEPPAVSSVFPREWPHESKTASDQSEIEAELEQLRSTVRIERPDQAGSEVASSEEATAVVNAEGDTSANPLRTSREDFLAAARRAARKASAQTMEETSDASRAKVRLQQTGSRRAARARPLTGLLVATLAVVLAVGIGVTTYSIFKGDLANPWGSVRGALVKGSGTAASAPAGAGQGKAAGGLSDTGSSSAPAATTAPEAIIDPPGTRSGPDADDGTTGVPRSVTTLPGGIIIDNGSLPSAISVAPARAAFSPDTESVTPQPAQAVPPVPAKRMMPPAAVGPLSLRLAAANGDPSAEFEVAVRLDEGRGVERNIKEAVVWYQRSASRGFAPAQYRLGTLYERGLGVAADRGRAMAWYRSAADKGNLKAMHNFAVLSASGEPADYKTAAHWFSEAAERGLVDSQYNLAVLYETGRGVDRNLKQAYKWFALAARGGDKEAMRRRDRVKWMLNANELKAAEELVQSWQPQPTEPLVNNVRAAGEAWKQREVQG